MFLVFSLSNCDIKTYLCVPKPASLTFAILIWAGML